MNSLPDKDLQLQLQEALHEKAIRQGKSDLASDILQDPGNAVVGSPIADGGRLCGGGKISMNPLAIRSINALYV
ncbi:MAG TPA: hypothetical protein VHE34_03305 [Puia sp.]|uniref:hypothetical protein n=1 Tax=Puia sp. TaxID=2045100 RepID=UPI002C68678F|nr:hypothetical protein [Puia sp.]HVU94219.1 hypothetical protein [Puia sp.]